MLTPPLEMAGVKLCFCKTARDTNRQQPEGQGAFPEAALRFLKDEGVMKLGNS